MCSIPNSAATAPRTWTSAVPRPGPQLYRDLALDRDLDLDLTGLIGTWRPRSTTSQLLSNGGVPSPLSAPMPRREPESSQANAPRMTRHLKSLVPVCTGREHSSCIYPTDAMLLGVGFANAGNVSTMSQQCQVATTGYNAPFAAHTIGSISQRVPKGPKGDMHIVFPSIPPRQAIMDTSEQVGSTSPPFPRPTAFSKRRR
ncbi:hypothetical protein E2P81_ATG00644 [Venturia nashicola]|uniref:Uncharacterized protein n=1 Tax=Venturia nashicola TaxID=86259 RepID=A0A4Z1PNX8_9PEZI|nr:hypothetical protein E6O75_ATG00656 [Venturia nashicola]TLD39657.1 hypothetical protein E2P81_ATG00644 [Venturia nashicola]